MINKYMEILESEEKIQMIFSLFQKLKDCRKEMDHNGKGFFENIQSFLDFTDWSRPFSRISL